MTPREQAARAARVAAYGSPTARTPADYTLKEALQRMDSLENVHQAKKQTKKATVKK